MSFAQGEGIESEVPCSCGSGKILNDCCLGKLAWPAPEGNGFSIEAKSFLEAAIDETIGEYVENYQVIFVSDEERNRISYAHQKGKTKDWKKSYTCMFPDCEARSIKRSHTIPKAMLRLISEDGHLLTPAFDHTLGALQLESIGLSSASIFPGFCKKHEQIFESFETRVKLSAPSDFALQIFRTVCREIVRKEHDIKHLEIVVSKMKTLRDDWFEARLLERLRAIFALPIGFSPDSVTLEIKDVISDAESELIAAKEDLVEFRHLFFDSFVSAFKTSQVTLPVVHLELETQLPLAMSGRGNFHVDGGDESKYSNIIAILNVVPREDGSDVFIAVPESSDASLNSYLKNFFDKYGREEGTLQMVESWMVYGSDHWFMPPSTWKKLSPSVQGQVLEKIASSENKNIAFEAAVSILEGVRGGNR